MNSEVIYWLLKPGMSILFKLSTTTVTVRISLKGLFFSEDFYILLP